MTRSAGPGSGRGPTSVQGPHSAAVQAGPGLCWVAHGWRGPGVEAGTPAPWGREPRGRGSTCGSHVAAELAAGPSPSTPPPPLSPGRCVRPCLLLWVPPHGCGPSCLPCGDTQQWCTSMELPRGPAGSWVWIEGVGWESIHVCKLEDMRRGCNLRRHALERSLLKRK